jgi:hypothetical protein
MSEAWSAYDQAFFVACEQGEGKQNEWPGGDKREVCSDDNRETMRKKRWRPFPTTSGERGRQRTICFKMGRIGCFDGMYVVR